MEADRRAAAAATPEGRRRAEADARTARWRRWGPYLSERGWGTVREDYSAGGDAWNFFPHDHARSRTYRWNEDGLAGICDIEQHLCLALALWNGADPILKERPFGLTNQQGNHGEDVKEYWWYVDSTPTHSWMRWLYHYPQAAFPYELLIAENARRGRDDPEYELLDTGIFDEGRFWAVTVEYAKSSPEDIVMRVTAENCGPDTATLHVLPTLWFRDTWSWSGGEARPRLWLEDGAVVAEHAALGRRVLRSQAEATPLFCENATNTQRLWGVACPPYPKDGINDAVVSGAPSVNPQLTGTKAALHHVLTVPGGERQSITLRLSEPDPAPLDAPLLLHTRESEADEFYAALTPSGTSADEALVMRRAFAGMLWGKQFYHLNMERWLSGDPTQPPPPRDRGKVRNGGWGHVDARDVISMPDAWEYPWFASWDLGFHCVALAHVDAEFAKRQLVLLCREWYMHPNGQLPAYEWSFDDVNPPVHAWAALRVFEVDGSRDIEFLERIFHKLLINFTWWVNRKDSEGNNIFQGGFLGLDNIGPFDRSMLPPGAHLEQSDGTAWMAMYSLHLLEMALLLAVHDDVYEDVATKFFEHFAYIAAAMDAQGLWDVEDGWYYDVIHGDDGSRRPVRAHSAVGMIALCAVTVLRAEAASKLPDFRRRVLWFLANKPEYSRVIDHANEEPDGGDRLLSPVDPDRLRVLLRRLLDESEFLSAHGLRMLSRYHLDHPLSICIDGVVATLDYEPGESRSGLYGGNSNWRGPVWFPINHLVIEALRRHHDFVGDGFTVECPTGSGRQLNLAAVAEELSRRLVSIFTLDASGCRPVHGGDTRHWGDPRWRDNIPFHEYFHGDTAAGLGASHQTGWTGVVGALIARREGV
ncbi:MAG: MGH1-like glycoside hydrolase domain-containing protein [Candidatus Dormibacteria bacterium]